MSLGPQSGRALSLLFYEVACFQLIGCHGLLGSGGRIHHREVHVAVMVLVAEQEERFCCGVGGGPEGDNRHHAQVDYVLSLRNHYFLTFAATVIESSPFDLRRRRLSRPICSFTRLFSDEE